jgi:plasmid stabilization system protein ParE
MIVEYHPALEAELNEIKNWYNARVPNLGVEFIDEIERQIFRIASNPKQWMVISGDLRRALVKRFPYVIYFRQVGPNRVRITAVKHQRRHPSIGRERR